MSRLRRRDFTEFPASTFLDESVVRMPTCALPPHWESLHNPATMDSCDQLSDCKIWQMNIDDVISDQLLCMDGLNPIPRRGHQVTFIRSLWARAEAFCSFLLLWRWQNHRNVLQCFSSKPQPNSAKTCTKPVDPVSPSIAKHQSLSQIGMPGMFLEDSVFASFFDPGKRLQIEGK